MVVHQSRPEILGMIRKVSHLLKIETQEEYEERLAKRLNEMQWKEELVVGH